MLQMGNIVKNPRIWLPAILTSMITGPHRHLCVQARDERRGNKLRHGRLRPLRSHRHLDRLAQPQRRGARRTAPPPSCRRGMDWLGLVLVCFVPARRLCWAFGLFFRRIGWIREGDLTSTERSECQAPGPYRPGSFLRFSYL